MNNPYIYTKYYSNNYSNYSLTYLLYYRIIKEISNKRQKIAEKTMNISTNAIVSNSEMIKNYRVCREKAENCGKIFVLKNNQPDAVLFSIREYERLSAFIEYMESLEDIDMEAVIDSLPKEGNRREYSIDLLKKELK